MEIIKVLWTQSGKRPVSVVSYDQASAQHRVDELTKDPTVTDVQTAHVKPGETVDVD